MPTLDFKGKQHIYAHHLTVPYRPLVPDAAKSLNAAAADDNLIIHGDNLHALKALLPRYAGRVKCIYIDPPYNTGNEGWVYNDKANSPLLKEWFKQQSPVDGEDLERHDKWLCMMWPRLHLLKELLADDGVIFVSIDDNEQHHLRMLMDEVFGAENFVTSVIWRKRGEPPNNKEIASITDYLVVYGSEHSINLRERGEGTGNFANPDKDPRGEWRYEKLFISNKGGRKTESMVYPISNPADGKEHWPPPNNRWAVSRENADRLVVEGRIVFGETRPVRKKFKSELRQGITWPNLWVSDNHGKFPMNRDATSEIVSIFSNESFETPKPVGLVDRILRIATGPNDIVLDSFAGSGTTAHAVLALNKADGGNRKFILVECEDYADSTTAERVRRVINGVPAARDKTLQAGLGGSFTYCTLGDPIDVEGMLTGEALPEYSALAAYLLHTTSGVSAGTADLLSQNDDGLFYHDDQTDYYLLYQPDTAYLSSNDGMLNEERARRISTANHQAGRKAIVFGPGKYIGQALLTRMGITFCQLPYQIHQATR